MPLDIIAMGEPLVELNQAEPGGAYLPGFGGDTSNAVIAAARSGARTGYFTAVGGDAFGRSLLNLWETEGVDATRVIVHATAPTGIYFVTHTSNGHEFSYLRAGSAASRLTPLDIPAKYIGSARVLHLSGISQAISASAADAGFAAIDAARRAGCRVSYDTNLRLKLWPLARARAIMHEAMRSADIALPGLDDAYQLTGLLDPDAIADFYLRLGPQVVALTLGSQGSLIATPQRRERVPSIKVKAADATGAGDAFDGAFLAEYLATGDPFAAGRYANAAAALSTLGYGAVAPLPRREAVERFLRDSG
ncbi:MAG: sugar kinase [Methylobacteriaceae bacterium]|nr:sugar kinase [Methylobacteriaceae bacterium]MBV9244248.1 sugar kinase [Methylobacteriaceae bacterium]MBV9636158.1 sugar kinase [Methylobacteriaceae bacterium]MBV9701457.1 sugar kinase [Methylobacteriaceae bacterium]